MAARTTLRGAAARMRAALAALSVYSSTTSAPRPSQPESGMGTPSREPTAAIRSAISASWGGTIRAPRPGPVTTRPPR